MDHHYLKTVQQTFLSAEMKHSCLPENFDLESSDGRVQQTFLSAGEF
jgi:hypothetical protein